MNLIKTFACYSTNEKNRLHSSSGAVFSVLAEYVFMQQGVVYGVAMSDDCYSAEFISVVDESGLKKIRGSKYLQAKIGNTFKRVKEDLQVGKLVLFTGTGCQVNGLKNYLGKEYPNLVCVDVICHGTPSPALWREYVRYREKNSSGKLKNVNFRCKDISWMEFGMKETLVNGTDGLEKKMYISKNQDPYMQMFLKNYCLRPSCYQCIAKKIKMSDLTIGDFWGINNVAPKMNDGKGTSILIVRTEIGSKVFNAIRDKMKVQEVNYKLGVKYNSAEYTSCARPLQRDVFFNDMKMLRFEEFVKKYTASDKISWKGRVKRKVKCITEELYAIWGEE